VQILLSETCDIQTEKGKLISFAVGSGGRMWTGRSQAPRGCPHRKLKSESAEVILSSSHAKKLASFFTRISSLDRIKSGHFSAI